MTYIAGVIAFVVLYLAYTYHFVHGATYPDQSQTRGKACLQAHLHLFIGPCVQQLGLIGLLVFAGIGNHDLVVMPHILATLPLMLLTVIMFCHLRAVVHLQQQLDGGHQTSGANPFVRDGLDAEPMEASTGTLWSNSDVVTAQAYHTLYIDKVIPIRMAMSDEEGCNNDLGLWQAWSKAVLPAVLVRCELPHH